MARKDSSLSGELNGPFGNQMKEALKGVTFRVSPEELSQPKNNEEQQRESNTENDFDERTSSVRSDAVHQRGVFVSEETLSSEVSSVEAGAELSEREMLLQKISETYLEISHSLKNLEKQSIIPKEEERTVEEITLELFEQKDSAINEEELSEIVELLRAYLDAINEVITQEDVSITPLEEGESQSSVFETSVNTVQTQNEELPEVQYSEFSEKKDLEPWWRDLPLETQIEKVEKQVARWDVMKQKLLERMSPQGLGGKLRHLPEGELNRVRTRESVLDQIVDYREKLKQGEEFGREERGWLKKHFFGYHRLLVAGESLLDEVLKKETTADEVQSVAIQIEGKSNIHAISTGRPIEGGYSMTEWEELEGSRRREMLMQLHMSRDFYTSEMNTLLRRAGIDNHLARQKEVEKRFQSMGKQLIAAVIKISLTEEEEKSILETLTKGIVVKE